LRQKYDDGSLLEHPALPENNSIIIGFFRESDCHIKEKYYICPCYALAGIPNDEDEAARL